jgi:hypothetical protein
MTTAPRSGACAEAADSPPTDPLEFFLATYFNMDFDIISGSPTDVLRDFATKEGPEAVEGARRGLAALLSRHPTDEGLLAEAQARGCEYLPADPGELRAFFEQAVADWPAGDPPDEPPVVFLRDFLDRHLADIWTTPSEVAQRFTCQGAADVGRARQQLVALLSAPTDVELAARATEMGWGGLPDGRGQLRLWLLEAVAVWDAFLAEHRATA